MMKEPLVDRESLYDEESFKLGENEESAKSYRRLHSMGKRLLYRLSSICAVVISGPPRFEDRPEDSYRKD